MWPIYSILLLIAMLVLRCVTSYYRIILGPTVLYLAHISNTEVRFVVSAYSIGSFATMIGSVVASFVNRKLKQKLNGLFVQAMVSLVLLASVTAVPWIKQIWELILIFFAIGFNVGYMLVDSQCVVLRIWNPKTSRILIYILYTMSSLGGFLAPVVARPFLIMSHESNPSASNCSLQVNNALNVERNESEKFKNHHQFDPAGWSYIIFGIVLFVVAILYIVLGCMNADERTYEVLVSSKDGDVSQSEEDPIRDVIWILIPAFLYCFCSTGSRLLYLDLSFAVAKCSSLNFSTSNAAWIRSLSSIGNGVGRFSGIILASHVKPVYIVATVATSSFLSMVTMALVARSWPAIMWAVSFFYGSFHGLMVPSVITWVSEITNVSGAYAFVFTFAGALGAMTVLPVGGALFHLSPFNVVYFLCGLNAFNLICFGAIWIAAKMKKPKESEQGTGSDKCKQ